MGKYLKAFKLKSLSKAEPIKKAEGIRNPWGLARYLAQKYRAVPPEIPFKELKQGQQNRIKEFYGAVATPSVQNRRGKLNRVEGTAATFGGKKTKQSAGAKKFNPNTSAGRRNLETAKKEGAKQLEAHRAKEKDTEKSLDVQKFLDFLAEDNIPALNKMISAVDDSPEGLFMQAVRKAMGKHSEQYKDIGKPQLLKAQSKKKAEPLQKVSPQLVAFLAGLAMSDDIVRSGGGSPRGEMTGAQAREWERTIARSMKRKSLKAGTTMEDLQKHWSDSSDTYVRRVPVAKGVTADETFLDKKLSSPPRAGEVWNPVSHRWTKDGNLGKVNVGSGGKKRLRAGSNAAGAHQRSVGGLSGKGKLRHLGTGRQFRSKIDIAESAAGTTAGVGSAKGAGSKFRTGAKKQITSAKPTSSLTSGKAKNRKVKKRR